MNVTELTLKLLHQRFQRMALRFPVTRFSLGLPVGRGTAQRNLIWTIDAHDQDAAPTQPPPEVEQQVDGTGVRPLEIIQHQ